MTLLGIAVSKISYLNQIFAAREVLKVLLQDHITIELGLSMRPFSEALETLLLTRFLFDEKLYIPASLREVNFKINKLDETSLESLDVFFDKYATYRQKVSTGTIGKTAQFWMMYLDLMGAQTMAHTAVQENYWKSLMYYWKQFLPMYFGLNKRNYARHLFKYQSIELSILSLKVQA